MVNTVLYTRIESAKANDLDVCAFLKYLPSEKMYNFYLESPDIIERYLSWASELPDECRLIR